MTDSTTPSLASGPDETETLTTWLEGKASQIDALGGEALVLLTVDEARQIVTHLRDLLRENAELKKDAERMDWMQATVDGTGKTMQFGGVCYWSIEVKAGKNGKPSRLGDGDDLRDAIDAAMSGAAGPSERGANDDLRGATP